MIKAKTKKNIFAILSAILGAVFAFITGVTYCVMSLNLQYGTKENSTTAYLGNQQFLIINDTLNNPVVYGEGTHNFEIALQYAIDYNFDVRFEYNVQWYASATAETGTPANNVILNFSNRDNIIYDENYIYFAKSVSAGSGKIPFITGVDFVSTDDSSYFGKVLKINILETKIYKQSEYNSDHKLLVGGSAASQTWYKHKTSSTSAEANLMMFNYRRNYEYGIPYIGLKTAYQKSYKTVTSNNSTTTTLEGSKWLGGNKAYAGTGVYVVTGNTPIRLKVSVEGAWFSGNNSIDTSDLISENSVKYNYAKDWTNVSWYNNSLWEVRSFDYVIKENSACYIDILESIEITSGSKGTDTVEFDKYRFVTNEIIINAGAEDVVFKYSQATGTELIKCDSIGVDEINEITGAQYSQPNIDVVNTSIFNSGLYSVLPSAEAQNFNTSISLINNTETTKKVVVASVLNYYLSNGNTTFSDKLGESLTNKRAEEYLKEGHFVTEKNAFDSALTYGYSIAADNGILTSTILQEITILPYSSATLVEHYSVSEALQDDTITKVLASTTTYNDVWLSFDVSINQNTGVANIENETTASLNVEKSLDENGAILSVKNNSNKKITGVTIFNLSVRELTVATYTALSSKPIDWEASYWKYYKKDGDVYKQIEGADPLAEEAEGYMPAQTYYAKSQYYTSNDMTISLLNDFEESSDDIINDSVELLPGESIAFASVSTTKTGHFEVVGSAVADEISALDTLVLINSGKSEAFLMNYSDSSYYFRFTGEISGLQTKFESIGEYNYYLGIVRPGQIIKVSMSEEGELDSNLIVASELYSASILTSAGWDSTVVNKLTKYFALIKS